MSRPGIPIYPIASDGSSASQPSSHTLAPREGSTLYYSLLHLPVDVRRAGLAILGLSNELSTTLRDVNEPQVAERKIHWWHEEIDRMHKGQARHPATQACEPVLRGNDDARQHCLDVLSHAANERYTPPDTEQGRTEQLRAATLARFQLWLTSESGHNNHISDPVLDWAAAVNEQGSSPLTLMADMDRLRTLPAWLSRGYPVFSTERYTAAALTPDVLAAGLNRSSDTGGPASAAADIRRRFLTAQIGRLQPQITEAINELNGQRPRVAGVRLSLLVLFALRHQQVRLWLRQSPNLLTGTVTATPIRKFLCTWRTTRRFAVRHGR